MGLVNKINKVLEKKVGLRLERTSHKIELTQVLNSSPSLVVEFMGASGVGKTTLRDYYLKSYSSTFPNKICTEADLKRFEVSIENLNFPQMEFYNQLFSTKLVSMGQKLESFAKNKKRFELFMKTLVEDCKIRYFLSDKTFFLDQHVFKFFTEDFLEMQNPEAQKELLRNRIIVYCYASPETIIRYIHKRAESGDLRSGHQNKNEKQLLMDLKEHMEARQREIKQLKNHGAFVVEVNTENKLDENAEMIHRFIQDYQKN